MLDRKRLAFGAVFGAILVAVTVAGIEFMASFHTPSWPARAMNTREPARERVLGTPFKRQPWLADPDNSWGMRDRERTVVKPSGTLRAVFVGDSFVESRFTPLSVPAAVERRLISSEDRIEEVNLPVGATDPRTYHSRIRNVALALHPHPFLLFTS